MGSAESSCTCPLDMDVPLYFASALLEPVLRRDPKVIAHVSLYSTLRRCSHTCLTVLFLLTVCYLFRTVINYLLITRARRRKERPPRRKLKHRSALFWKRKKSWETKMRKQFKLRGIRGKRRLLRRGHESPSRRRKGRRTT